MRYLDPKADLTFKKVFGEHKHLVKSLLNALLPFENPEDEVESLEYLPVEMVPDNPLRKNSIVDVRCKDNRGRQFIVEMQMVWSQEFKQRVLFNASKAYVRQLGHKQQFFFNLQTPQYSLNLSTETLIPESEEFYHYYPTIYNELTNNVINNLHLILVELPKFSSHRHEDQESRTLWLRYLTEIADYSRKVPQDLLDNCELKEAVDLIEESTFSDAELFGHDKFWDIISVERTLMNSAERRQEEIHKEWVEKGRKEEKLLIAQSMKSKGYTTEAIAEITGLSPDEIKNL